VEEGEPECHDDYVDAYNGGCNSDPYVFQAVCGNADGTLIICGKSGTYLFQGWSYRDTDWFEVQGTGGLLTASLFAEFRSQLIFIYGTDCAYPQYDLVMQNACEYGVLSRPVEAGGHAWLWVGPAAFSGVGCASHYLLEMAGITPCGTPAADTRWGEIKALFQ